MRHILHKGRLLLFGLHDQLGSLFQFLVKVLPIKRRWSLHIIGVRVSFVAKIS